MLQGVRGGGRCRRGYFVDGLGGAQFAAPGAVDRMRGLAEPPKQPRDRRSWPPPTRPTRTGRPCRGPSAGTGARRPPPGPQGRRRGGRWSTADSCSYVERGGRTLLTFADDAGALQPAVDALALAVREGALGRITVERADGGDVFDTPLARALADAGIPAVHQRTAAPGIIGGRGRLGCCRSGRAPVHDEPRGTETG